MLRRVFSHSNLIFYSVLFALIVMPALVAQSSQSPHRKGIVHRIHSVVKKPIIEWQSLFPKFAQLFPEQSNGNLIALMGRTIEDYASGKAPSQFFVVDMAAHRILWQAPMTNFHGGDEKHVYFIQYGEQVQVRACEWTSGRQVWEQKVGSNRSVEVRAGQGVVLLYDGSQVFCLESATGRTRWQVDMTGEMQCLVPKEILFLPPCHEEQYLMPLSLATGRQLARTRFPFLEGNENSGSVSYLPATQSLLGWKIAVDAGLERKDMYVTNRKGDVLWSVEGGSGYSGPENVQVGNDLITYTDCASDPSEGSHGIVAVDIKTGKQRWRHKPSDRRSVQEWNVGIWNNGDMLMRYDEAQSRDVTLASLNLKGGRPQWSLPLPSLSGQDVKAGTEIIGIYGNRLMVLEQAQSGRSARLTTYTLPRP